MKWGAVWLLMGTLALGTTGCGDDDPAYEDVTPPTVEASYSINGRVTAVSGEGLAATVTVDGSETVKTNADGSFSVAVTAGSHTLRAEADGKIAKEGTVEVTASNQGEAVAWNVVLSNVGTSVTAAEDGSATGNMTSETLQGNELAEVEVQLTAEAGALPDNGSIVMTSLYAFDEALIETKAGDRQMLYGVSLSSSDASVTLNRSISLALNVGSEMASMLQAQKLVDGQWVAANSTVEGDVIRLEADELTSYALSFEASISSSSATEAIAFDTDFWDNLTGGSNVSVSGVGYNYRQGLDLAAGANRMEAYLVELLGRHTGSSSVASLTGSYDLNVTLPIGTGMRVSASQTVMTFTATAGSYSASAKYYGNISFHVTTYNRQHTGGGSL